MKDRKQRGPIPANTKPVKPVTIDRFTITINGSRLTGEKLGDHWTFECPRWPDLVRSHNGATSADQVVAEFMPLALADAVVIERGK